MNRNDSPEMSCHVIVSFACCRTVLDEGVEPPGWCSMADHIHVTGVV